MKLVVHIGLERTGSTYLQEFLCCERVELSRLGIFPIVEGRMPQYRGHYYSVVLPFCESPDIRLAMAADENYKSVRVDRSNIAEDLRSFIRSASAKNCEICLLSSELLASRLTNPQQISDFDDFLLREVGFTEIEYIVFLRDPSEMYISLRSAHLYFGGLPLALVAIDEGDIRFNHNLLLRNWREVVEERLTVFEYKKNHNSVDQIINWLRPGVEYRRIGEYFSNSSLSAVVQNILFQYLSLNPIADVAQRARFEKFRELTIAENDALERLWQSSNRQMSMSDRDAVSRIKSWNDGGELLERFGIQYEMARFGDFCSPIADNSNVLYSLLIRYFDA